jgi:competence protein ComEC
MNAAASALLAACLAVVACSRRGDVMGVPLAQGPAPSAGPMTLAKAPVRCGGGGTLTVRFYDVGQGLAALVTLPDGRHVLVDAGDSPRRPNCGEACANASARLLRELQRDLAGTRIDLVWITHPHSDHVGGAPEVLGAFAVGTYVDNGRDTATPEVQRARMAAAARGVPVHVVDPTNREVPLAPARDVTLASIVPPAWPASCRHDANECSIGLRLDFCASSVVFPGDAEHAEEKLLDIGGPVTLLQVAHHGSDTSTSPALLAQARPKYAVISAGRPDVGLNREYCHPRALVVQRLTRVLGGPGGKTLEAFDGDRCDRATPADWIGVPASDRLWATERDGDVVLTTTGDGSFHREP